MLKLVAFTPYKSFLKYNRCLDLPPGLFQYSCRGTSFFFRETNVNPYC